MEYERIDKAQTGIISPSKLRMKLMGPHHQKRKGGSNCNSSRTSPSKLEDSEFVNNSLLASQNGDLDELAPGIDVSTVKRPTEVGLDHHQRENGGDMGRPRMLQFSRPDSINLSSIHPVRTLEEENLDYDSNASSSSFEFHKADRSLHSSITRSVSRPVPSKWNNAEKWIMNRHGNAHAYCSKKSSALQGQGGRFPVTNIVRVAPDSGSYNHMKLDLSSQIGMEKFSFASPLIHPSLCQPNWDPASSDICIQTKDFTDFGDMAFSQAPSEDSTALPGIRSVAMRDTGTEMTPIPSQEPSRTGTPVGATTPHRSPSSSLPSTPRTRAPACTPTEYGKTEMSEQEMKQKTRTEIVALGVQLGKMNIAAAWASKDDQEKNASVGRTDALDRVENEKQADAWKEAENAKHLARYKREEIMIQAWESRQKEKLDSEIISIEARIEQLRTKAHAKMLRKIEKIRLKSERKRAAEEGRRIREAERTAAQADYIRQTGQIPSSNFICCGWF